MEIFHKSEHFQGNVKPIYSDESKTYNETIKNAIEKKVALNGANLSNMDLSNLNFSGMNLTGVIFAHSNIDNSCFENCDLRDSDFSGINLVVANFNNADTRRLETNEYHVKYDNLMQ